MWIRVNVTKHVDVAQVWTECETPISSAGRHRPAVVAQGAFFWTPGSASQRNTADVQVRDVCTLCKRNRGSSDHTAATLHFVFACSS